MIRIQPNFYATTKKLHELFGTFCIFVVKFRILFPFHDYKFEGRRLKADGRPPLAVRLDGFSHPAG